MTRLSDLAARLAGLEADALKRTRRRLESPQGVSVTIDGRDCVSFCSNDYLGLAAHPGIARAVEEGVRRYGTGAGASHLLTGHSEVHEALERDLARFSGFPSALLFSSGYMANLGVVTALLGRGDAVFGDRLNHACLNDGALLSRATFHRHPHGDLAALERQLAASEARVRMIMVDGVFSMDGDIAPLPELLDLARRHDAWLLVDDAHGFGVLGENGMGLAEQEGLQRRITFQMGTLSKAAGLSGGYLAASREWIDLLTNRARSFIYSTAPPPALAHAAITSLELIRSDEGRQLRRRLLAHLSHFPGSTTPIVPIHLGSNEAALAAASALEDAGFLVPAIRYPTVPRGKARLRISLSAAHSGESVRALAAAL